MISLESAASRSFFRSSQNCDFLVIFEGMDELDAIADGGVNPD
jgi:hypothetical protein